VKRFHVGRPSLLLGLLGVVVFVLVVVLLLHPSKGQASSPGGGIRVDLPYSVTNSMGSGIGQGAYWFECQAGDVVEVRAMAAGNGSVQVDLHSLPYGNPGGRSTSLPGRVPASISYTVEEAGRWEVVVNPAPGSEIPASYSVSIWFSSRGTTTTTSPVPPSTTSTTAPHETSFSDVPASHHYAAQIDDLASRGIIAGYSDGAFRPDNPVMRQQFAKMIVKTLGLPVSDQDLCPFADVPSGLDGSDPLYPSAYVAVCASQHITMGKSPTAFAPYDLISRQQLITMISRAANLPEPPPYYEPPFSSTQFEPEEHYLNARKSAYAGLLDKMLGIGADYDFFLPATRGEVACLLVNLLNYPPPTAEAAAIREAIGRDLSLYLNEFSLAQLKTKDTWAGALIIAHLLQSERMQILLEKKGDEWVMVGFGRGEAAGTWTAHGAPAELAEWLEQIW
jgi:hypothetical protein